jgi:predicted ABC-type ATPase
VQIRVENGGHFVPEYEIESRYKLGYENLNNHWTYFDEVYLLETSTYKKEPHLILTVVNNKIVIEDKIPTYLDSWIPTMLR